MRKIISLIFLFFAVHSVALTQSTVTISGYAPAYVGKQIEINQIEDYLSLIESPIISTTVQKDSTFKLTFSCTEMQKVSLKVHQNKSTLYIQPAGNYELFVPEKDDYNPYNPNGNKIEITFLNLDSTDINYKILQFQRWQDEYIGEYYYLKNVKPIEFSKKIDAFKQLVSTYYQKDTSVFFKTYVKFTVAGLDNIQFAVQRNRYEKYDFYIKNEPVSYNNDAYMNYIATFYEKMMPRFSMEVNNRVYLGLLKSSPTLIMRALGNEFTLKNIRLREIIMVKCLAEEFYSSDLPQTNILTVLDSVANSPLFKSNGIIAKNLIARLTELVSGGKAPDFALKNSINEQKTLNDYKKKYTYIHFFNPESAASIIELEPLFKLYEGYKDHVNFITIYPEKEYATDIKETKLKSIVWDKFAVTNNHRMLSNYKITQYPSYVLIDPYGYIVAAPALSPTPNGQYLTIEKVFFSIKKLNYKY
jgi:hypothetical protein